jgi:type IV secretion system protein VirB10
MLAPPIDDPRLQALFSTCEPDAKGIRPVVRLPARGLPPTLFLIAAVILAATLFSIVNQRRLHRAQTAASTKASGSLAAPWPEPPPLFIPAGKIAEAPLPSAPITSAALPPPPESLASRGVRAQLRPAPPPAPSPSAAHFISSAVPRAVQPRASGAPLLVNGDADPRLPFPPAPRSSSELPTDERVHASVLANPSLTVPQGTLIRAVLETGFDSTKPGFARAIVSLDVRSFDAKNILIPRGSRLIGESSSSVSNGEQRASIIWKRLICPNGVTIELDSPATDPVGRGGLPASVDTHFFDRVGDAIGRTVSFIGQIFAARATPFIVVSGGTPTAPRVATHPKRDPTLKVAPGTSISVFVAHDLEFAEPEEPS